MKSLKIVMLICISFGSYAQNTDIILNKYIALKDALVKSDNKVVPELAVAFQEVIDATQPFTEKEDILRGIKKMIKSNDIEKQRVAFSELSPFVWKALKKSSINHDVYYQYCPMKKVYWISLESTIKNPYYGISMLSCGDVTDKKLK